MKLTLVLFAALMLSASPAAAGDDDDYYADHDVARDAVGRGAALPLERILVVAARHARGEIVEVELDEDDGHLLYEVKVLTRTGAVRELKLDARTGVLLDEDDD